MGTLSVMDTQEGHLEIKWSRDDRDQIAAARAAFDAARKKGMLTYRIGVSGRQGAVIKDFDPDAEGIIATPAVVGG